MRARDFKDAVFDQFARVAAVQEVRAVPQGVRIDIDIRYAVRATNREDNLVFPFFVGDLP